VYSLNEKVTSQNRWNGGSLITDYLSDSALGRYGDSVRVCRDFEERLFLHLANPCIKTEHLRSWASSTRKMDPDLAGHNSCL